MVQIAVKKPIIVAQPIGHSVPFSNCVQTSCVLFVLGELIDPTGNQITKIRMMTQLQMVPTLLTPAKLTCQLIPSLPHVLYANDAASQSQVERAHSHPMNQVLCIVTNPCMIKSPSSVR